MRLPFASLDNHQPLNASMCVKVYFFLTYCGLFSLQLTQYVGVLRLMKAPAAQVSAKLLSAHRTRSLRMIHAFKQALLQGATQSQPQHQGAFSPAPASAIGGDSSKSSVAGENLRQCFCQVFTMSRFFAQS